MDIEQERLALERLKIEGELELRRREVSLKESRRADSGPPRRSDPSVLKYIAVMGAFITAVIPISTGISGWYSLRLAEAKQAHEARTSYLDRVLAQSDTPQARETVLKFVLSVVNTNDPLVAWARSQLDDLNKAYVARKELDSALSTLNSAREQSDIEKRKLLDNISRLRREIREAEAKALVSRAEKTITQAPVLQTPDRSSTSRSEKRAAGISRQLHPPPGFCEQGFLCEIDGDRACCDSGTTPCQTCTLSPE